MCCRIRGKNDKKPKLMIEEKISKKRSLGRCQNLWLQDLRCWFNCLSIEVCRVAVSKIQSGILIA